MIEYICEFEKGDFAAVKGEPKLIEDLIRCKDCEFFHEGATDKEYGNCGWTKSLVTTLDYCSFAERKTDGATD